MHITSGLWRTLSRVRKPAPSAERGTLSRMPAADERSQTPRHGLIRILNPGRRGQPMTRPPARPPLPPTTSG